MADAGDLKSPVRNGRVGSTPTSATIFLVACSPQTVPLLITKQDPPSLQGYFEDIF
jgi:hypothetical protein